MTADRETPVVPTVVFTLELPDGTRGFAAVADNDQPWTDIVDDALEFAPAGSEVLSWRWTGEDCAAQGHPMYYRAGDLVHCCCGEDEDYVPIEGLYEPPVIWPDGDCREIREVEQ